MTMVLRCRCHCRWSRTTPSSNSSWTRCGAKADWLWRRRTAASPHACSASVILYLACTPLAWLPTLPCDVRFCAAALVQVVVQPVTVTSAEPSNRAGRVCSIAVRALQVHSGVQKRMFQPRQLANLIWALATLGAREEVVPAVTLNLILTLS